MEQATFFTNNQQQIENKLVLSHNHLQGKYYSFFVYLLLAFLGFLLGRAELSGFFPLALVYWSIITGINKYLSIMVTLATGLGLIWTGNYLNLVYLIAGIIGFIFYNSFKGYKVGLLDKVFFISLVYLFISLSVNYFSQVLLYRYFLTIGETLFIYILIGLGLEGMEELINHKKKLTKIAIITILIITSGALIGLANIKLIPEMVIEILVLLSIIGVAHTIGFTYGIMTAVLYGLVMVSADLIPLLTMLKFIITAFTCGLFQKKNKLWIFAGVILAFLVYSGFSPTIYDLKDSVNELIIAGIIFLLIPEGVWQRLFAGLTRETVRISDLELDSDLSQSLNRHLLELARVFNELSLTFKEVLPEERDNQRLGDFIYIFKNKICRHCQRVKICWQQEKKDTYQRMVLMVDAGERRGNLDKEIIERFLRGKCVHINQILAGVKSSFELYQLNNFWRDRLNDKQQIVSEQLAGISEIIQHFSNSSKLTLKRAPSLKDIKEKALKSGIDIYNIELNSNLNSAKLNFKVTMDPCAGNNPCEEQVLRLLNTEYEADFRTLTRSCGDKLKDKPCQIEYGPVGDFRLDLTFLQRASSGAISGDSYIYKPLRDGKDLIVLSDGMGVGKKAALESKAAINLLESIINAGFDQKLAIKTINLALYLRNQEESFTTLDIGLFDTFTGEITFSKIGAVASYIKRGWDLIEVDSASLPAGILDKIEVSSRSFKLQDNDFVIMVTDGVMEARPEKDWLKQLLQNSSFDRVQDLADYIFEIIHDNNHKARDDMTIVVFKVEEILQKRRKFKV